MIQATGISKKYGPITAIDNISFEVKPGEVVGLLGPNGAGKTTTMRILTGFMPPTSGEVHVDGVDILEKPIECKKKIGYLPETPPLYPELTVLESLSFVAGIQKVTSPKKQVEKILKKTGLLDVKNRLIHNLSKGYRQRVGIAQALIHEPDIIILDEPTIGLDPKQILEIRVLIQSLRGEQAIIFSSHILQEVSAVCDRVIIIHQGKIVADKKVSELHQSSQTKKFLVTAKEGSNGIQSTLEKLDGVARVENYATDLEELFLKLTHV